MFVKFYSQFENAIIETILESKMAAVWLKVHLLSYGTKLYGQTITVRRWYIYGYHAPPSPHLNETKFFSEPWHTYTEHAIEC